MLEALDWGFRANNLDLNWSFIGGSEKMHGGENSEHRGIQEGGSIAC